MFTAIQARELTKNQPSTLEVLLLEIKYKARIGEHSMIKTIDHLSTTDISSIRNLGYKVEVCTIKVEKLLSDEFDVVNYYLISW